MIVQEIKLYDEPAPPPVAYNASNNPSYHKGWDHATLMQTIEEAEQIGITVGLKFKYKSQKEYYQIVRTNLFVNKIWDHPAVFECHRFDENGKQLSDLTTGFSLPEILAENKEILW